MFLIVGLGNPGSEYKSTRHNAGFLAVDQIISEHKLEQLSNKFNAELYKGIINNQKVIALKPLTYMNNSGISVSEFTKFYKIPLTNIIVIHDELDLPTGVVKDKIGGGSAGHNGIKSLDQYIGKEYTRIRIGIDHPSKQGLQIQVSDYVLAKPSKEETLKLDEAIVEASELVTRLITLPTEA
jgi:PTH1 family peptidyl-tRNA hydrolase